MRKIIESDKSKAPLLYIIADVVDVSEVPNDSKNSGLARDGRDYPIACASVTNCQRQ